MESSGIVGVARTDSLCAAQEQWSARALMVLPTVTMGGAGRRLRVIQDDRMCRPRQAQPFLSVARQIDTAVTGPR